MRYLQSLLHDPMYTHYNFSNSAGICLNWHLSTKDGVSIIFSHTSISSSASILCSVYICSTSQIGVSVLWIPHDYNCVLYNNTFFGLYNLQTKSKILISAISCGGYLISWWVGTKWMTLDASMWSWMNIIYRGTALSLNRF